VSIDQTPITLPNFVALGKTMYEKTVTKLFTPFSILAPQGDLLGKSSSIWILMYCKAANINLPNFVDFFNGETDKNSKCCVCA